MEVMYILRLKKLIVGARKSIKIASIIILATVIILGILQLAYSQTYEVSLNGNK